MLTAPAKKRLKEVAQTIEEEPLRIDMCSWVVGQWALQLRKARNEVPVCGIIGCIAGWVVALEYKQKRYFAKRAETMDIQVRAQTILSLTDKQTERLFFVFNWPAQFRGSELVGNWAVAGNHETQTPEYAKVVAARIKHFIRTNGEE